MKDLSSVEEDALPLPRYWERVQSASMTTGGVDSGGGHSVISKKFFYRNISTGLESFEHPYIHEASETARAMKLSDIWLVKEAVGDDGESDYYYYNSDLRLSLWDHPLVRQCLSDILGSDGHSSAAMWILTKDIENIASVSFINSGGHPMISDGASDGILEEELFGHDKISSAYSRFREFQSAEQDGQFSGGDFDDDDGGGGGLYNDDGGGGGLYNDDGGGGSLYNENDNEDKSNQEGKYDVNG